MTSDELISMGKACDEVLMDLSFVSQLPDSQSAHAVYIRALHKSVAALAVIQRDLIKAALGG